MTSERCCICNRCWTDPVTVKRRKRFYGKSCGSSRKVLNELLLEAFSLPVLAFKETSDQDALLCHFCNLQLTNLSKYIVKVKEIKEDIIQKASQLNRLPGTSLPAPVIGRKRSSVSVQSNSVIRRRLHLPTPTNQLAAGQSLPSELSQDQDDVDLNESLNSEGCNESVMSSCSPQTPCRQIEGINDQPDNFNQPLGNDESSNHGTPSVSVSISTISCVLSNMCI